MELLLVHTKILTITQSRIYMIISFIKKLMFPLSLLAKWCPVVKKFPALACPFWLPVCVPGVTASRFFPALHEATPPLYRAFPKPFPLLL